MKTKNNFVIVKRINFDTFDFIKRSELNKSRRPHKNIKAISPYAR